MIVGKRHLACPVHIGPALRRWVLGIDSTCMKSGDPLISVLTKPIARMEAGTDYLHGRFNQAPTLLRFAPTVRLTAILLGLRHTRIAGAGATP